MSDSPNKRGYTYEFLVMTKMKANRKLNNKVKCVL